MISPLHPTTLPLLELDQEREDDLLEDVIVGDVPREEAIAFRNLGIRIAHA